MFVSERGLHIFDAVYVWQAGNVVKERWRGPAADFLMDLKCGAAAELPGVEHKGGGDDTKVLEGLYKEGAGHGGAPWVVPGIGSSCVCEGVYQVGGPGSLPKEFTVRAVDEAST